VDWSGQDRRDLQPVLLHQFLAQLRRRHLLVCFRLGALGRGGRRAVIEDSVAAAGLQLTQQILKRSAANQFRLVRREAARRARLVAADVLEDIGVAFLAEAVAVGAPGGGWGVRWVSDSCERGIFQAGSHPLVGCCNICMHTWQM